MKHCAGHQGRLGLLLAGLLGVPAIGFAQVIEIDAAGSVRIFDGPTAIHADGAVESLRPSRRAPQASMQVARAQSHEGASEAAAAADLSPHLVDAVAWRESRWRAGVVSRAGAIGEMQLMPSTARGLGVDPFDSRQNYLGGATYLKSLLRRYGGDLVLSLAAYNAGPGAVDRYGGVPPFKETRAYVADILDRLSASVALTTSTTKGKPD